MTSAEALRLSREVFNALGDTDPIYTVLDGARRPTISSWAIGTKAPAWCLYRGKLNPDLAEVAPYLLRMGRGHGYVEEFFERGWHDFWGVAVSSAAPSRELRQHLRKYLKVLTEDNRGLIFRWYDPRVLRVYLPTCTLPELKHFFGPISAFVSPDDDPRSFTTWRLGLEGLETKTVSLTESATG